MTQRKILIDKSVLFVSKTNKSQNESVPKDKANKPITRKNKVSIKKFSQINKEFLKIVTGEEC